MNYRVETPHFQGPLELLLELIEKRKLFINDISLAQVTDDYIAYTQAHTEHTLEQNAQFVLIASTLLLIKSKSLLPTLTLTEEEKVSIDDLEARLTIYKQVKELSRHLETRFGKTVLFEAEDRPNTPVFSPDKNLSIASIHEAIKRVLTDLPKKEALPKTVVRKVISLEDMIENLTKRVTGALRMSFKEFSSGHKGDKVNVIVGFLAMLELVKQGIVHVNQEKHFDDINMETEGIGIPRY